MGKRACQFSLEVLLAYPVAAIATFLEALLEGLVLPAWIRYGPLGSPASYFFGEPVLASFWIMSGLVATAVALHGRCRPAGVFGASRAGEWVWVVGTVYIIVGYFSYMPIGRGWEHAALYELFASREDIGNVVTAPFYMGIAYSLSRHLLRRRAERR